MKLERRFLYAIICFSLCSQMVACSESPKDAYFRVIEAAKLGDEETFLNGFTKNSRNLISAMLTLTKEYGSSKDPYKYILGSTIKNEYKQTVTLGDLIDYTDLDAKILGFEDAKNDMKLDLAILEVTAQNRTNYIVMYQQDKKWKIDAFLIEKIRTEKKFREAMLK